MTIAPRLHRVLDLKYPEPLRVEIHEPDCGCPACETFRPVAAPPQPRLTLMQIGNLTWLGLAIGTAIAFAVDRQGVWLTLSTVLTGGRS